MSSLNPFQTNVYSEELYQVSEADFDVTMVEQGQMVVTSHGEILINKECSHTDCHTTRCGKGASYMGIAI
jgi:hypothetical protein